MMELSAITTLATTTLSDFGDEVLIVLSAIVGVAIAYFLYKFSYTIITGQSGIGWAWLDKMTYKPYKGYNRLRSKKWNMEHTMN